MKYETPELTVLTPAISAVQSTQGGKALTNPFADGSSHNDASGAYADWE